MIILTATDTTTQHVSTADLKTHMRVSDSADDAYIGSLCLAAQDFITRETGRTFADSTYDAYLPEFPSSDGGIELTHQPVSSVTHIKYYNSANNLTTLDSSNYHTMTPTNTASWVEPVYNFSWPSTYTRPDAVNIKYVCSYSAVPEVLKHTIKLLVATWYENREDISEKKVSQLPLGVERLLNQLRVLGVR